MLANNYCSHTVSSRPMLSCPKCREWRLKFCSIVEEDSDNLLRPTSSSLYPSSNYYYRDAKKHRYYDPRLTKQSTMVIETQRIFRRSLPPETVLERSSSSLLGKDAPQFSEIVVVTTRRGEEQQSTRISSPTPSSPYLIKRHKEISVPTGKRLMEDDDQLKTLRERVERYRKDIVVADDVDKRSTVREKLNYVPYARSRLASYSYDDADLTYDARVRPRPVSTTPFCHCHPPTAAAAAPVSSGYAAPVSSRYSLAKSQVSLHAAPPVAQPADLTYLRRMELLQPHVHQHVVSSSLKRSADVEPPITRRSRSEMRSNVDVYLESAGNSLEKLRANLRETTNKFSKHRQMIDRYLRLDPGQRLENVEPAVIKKYDEVAERIPELLIMNYGLNRRPIDAASLWSTSITSQRSTAPIMTNRGLRMATPFEIRGRIRSVVSRTAQSVPRF